MCLLFFVFKVSLFLYGKFTYNKICETCVKYITKRTAFQEQISHLQTEITNKDNTITIYAKVQKNTCIVFCVYGVYVYCVCMYVYTSVSQGKKNKKQKNLHTI